ncbi:MAG: hypothetical protein EA398_07285 [Deltaproteobacteria bacterium]|nr:MAG: hypothetical protein EA398_07285 [Deltaproteobacteria bacterium]
MRTTGFWLLLLGALLLTGCSVVLSLDADCDTVSDCTPYVCGDDNVACRASCSRDAHCAAGFSCDFTTNTCLESGCRPSTPVVRLDVSDQFVGFAASAGAGQAILNLEHPSGHFLQRYEITSPRLDDGTTAFGTLVAIRESSVDSDLGAFRLSVDAIGTNASQLPASLYNPRGQSGLDHDFFHFAWRGQDRDSSDRRRWVLTGRSLRLSPDPAIRPRSRDMEGEVLTATSGASERVIRQVRLAPREGGFAHAWAESVGVGNGVLRLRFRDGDGNRDGEVLRVFANGDGVISSFDMLAFRDRLMLAWVPEISATRRDIRTVTVSGDRPPEQPGAALGSGETYRLYETAGAITDVVLASAGSLAAIAWRESSGGSERFRIRLAWLDENGRPAAGRDGLVRVDPNFVHQVTPGARLSSASRNDDFVLLFSGSRAGRNDLWLSRFAGGAQVGLPVPVTDLGLPGEAPPSAFSVVPFAQGYTAFWMQEQQGGNTMFYRSFRCADGT